MSKKENTHLTDVGAKSRNATRGEWLKSRGFKNYAEYLRSDLWASIRERVFSLKGRSCVGCRKFATVVHHRRYDGMTMSGGDLRGLVPMCMGCHKKIEFSGKRKNSLSKANNRLKKLKKQKLN